MTHAEIPTPYVIGLHRYTPTSVASDRAPQKAWTPPKTQQGQKFFAQGWGPAINDGGDTEPRVDQDIERLSVYIPPVLHEAVWDGTKFIRGDALEDPGPMDVIDLPVRRVEILDGQRVVHDWTQYEVMGWLRDYTNGPWGWQPGKVIDIRRVSG